MYRIGVLGMAALLFVNPASALSEASTGNYQKLVAAMKEEIAQGQKKGKNAKGPDPEVLPKISMLQNLEKSGEEGGEELLGESLSYLTNTFSSDPVKKAALELKASLAVDQQAAAKEQVVKLQEQLQRMIETVREAKTAADLDGLLVELGNARLTGRRDDAESQALYRRLENLKNFVSRWQDYLSAKSAGDTSGARQALSNVISNSRDTEVFPRSELLALLRSLDGSGSNAADIVAGIKSLDDMREALLLLGKIRQSGGSDTVGPLLSALASLEKTYREYLAGLPVALELNSNYQDGRNSEALEKIAELRAMLMKLVLPRYIGAPKDMVARGDESVTGFLERVVEEAKAREDSDLANRAREALKTMSRVNTYTGQDATGLNAYVSGQKQEQAGQYELAVVSFQQALKSGSDLVPAKAIGAHLDAIKAGHPDEYNKGVERFLEPPVSRYPGDYRGLAGRNQPPDSQRPAPALLIPAPKSDAPVKTEEKKEEEAAPKKEAAPAEKAPPVETKEEPAPAKEQEK